jgi:hypothetical protein
MESMFVVVLLVSGDMSCAIAMLLLIKECSMYNRNNPIDLKKAVPYPGRDPRARNGLWADGKPYS